MSQPLDVLVNESNQAVLHVVVSGTLPQYQWFKNGAALLHATNAILTFSPAVLDDAGHYFVTVTGPINAVTSRVAAVRGHTVTKSSSP